MKRGAFDAVSTDVMRASERGVGGPPHQNNLSLCIDAFKKPSLTTKAGGQSGSGLAACLLACVTCLAGTRRDELSWTFVSRVHNAFIGM